MNEFPRILTAPHYEFTVGENQFTLGLKGVTALNKALEFLDKDPIIISRFSARAIRREVEKVLGKV